MSGMRVMRNKKPATPTMAEKESQFDDIPIGQSYSYDPQSDDADNFEDEYRDKTTKSRTTKLSSRPRVRLLLFAAGALLLLAVVGLIIGRIMESSERGPTARAMAYLQELEVTLPDDFALKNSPQRQAVEWMVNRDPLKLGISDHGFVQRYVVAVFVFALAVPSSKDTTLRKDLRFLSGYHECDWQAKWESRHDKTGLFMGIFCDDDKQVNKIILPTLGLTGQFPAELASLERLQKIVLDDNQLTGTMPYLPSLTHLSLAYNNIAGSLSSHLGLMTKLQELILTENMITGELPKEIEKLSLLRRLAIGGNDLTIGISNVFHLTQLEELYGAFNSFEDQLDNESFRFLTNLKILDLKNNRLQGPFPDALWTLPKLQVLDFHFNALDGHLREIDDKYNPVLEYLDVSENFLSGGMPTTLNKVTKLVHLDVSSNRFDKTLQGDFSALTNLEALLMTDSSSFGPQPIPSWLQQLTNLRHLSLKLTGRTGTIPDWFFTSLNQLEILDMDWNRISGTIPSSIAQVTTLEHLLLNRNWLEGTVPSEVSNLPNLKTIMVDNNRLVGELMACQASSVVADCGNPLLGCPNCISDTTEVNCPCCTRCCYDENELCNTEDWITFIINHKLKENPTMFYPSTYKASDYTPKDSFVAKAP